MKTIPKKFRGTWYHYEKADGYDYQKISATKIKDHFQHKTKTYTMHQFDRNIGITKKHSSWMFGIKETKSVYILSPWNAYANYGFDDGDHSFLSSYKMTTRKYKGKKVKVVREDVPSRNYWYIYSPSKALAKHLWNIDNK